MKKNSDLEIKQPKAAIVGGSSSGLTAKAISPSNKIKAGGGKSDNKNKGVVGKAKSKTSVNPGILAPGTVIVPKGQDAVPNSIEQTLDVNEQLNLNNVGNDKASTQYFNNPFQPASGSSEAPGNAAWGGIYDYGKSLQMRATLRFANREAFRVTAFGFWGPQNTSLTTGNVPLSAVGRNKMGKSLILSAVGGQDRGQLRWPWMPLHNVTGTTVSDYTNSATFGVNSNIPPSVPALVSFWVCIDSNGPVLVNGVDVDIQVEYRVVYFSRITSVLTYRDDFGDLVSHDQDSGIGFSPEKPGLKPDTALALMGLTGCRKRLDPGEFAVQMPNSYVCRFHYKDEDAFFNLGLTFVRDLAPFPYALWHPGVKDLIAEGDIRRFDIEMKIEPFFGFCGLTWSKVLRLKTRLEEKKMRTLFLASVKNNGPPDQLLVDNSELRRKLLCAETFLQSILVNGKSVTDSSTNST
jgi:hypothetical protein